MIIATGCPRSGTKYLAHQWQGKGYDVRHEALGAHGIVSWCISANASCWPRWHGPVEREQLKGDWVHLVREPLACIASLTTVEPISVQWASAYAPGIELHAEPIARAASFWVEWNTLAEGSCARRERLEDIAVPGEERVNARGHEAVTWRDLETIGEAWVDRVRAMAERYGYAITDNAR